MKKLSLLTQHFLGSIYILFMIGLAITGHQGRLFAFVMLFFLGIWQYSSALIWIIRGDRRRRQYFLWATIYLLVSIVWAYSDLNERFENLALAALSTLPISLAIWYQIIVYRHYKSLEEMKEQLEDDNGASQLL